ncbi:dehydrogenase [Acidilobus saccharovorans 345-15]|uniref:Dehydrogenase n=1 Tax=Acidilobus saccharovorans (strain DSM 16705 / JCM 18335 / VKM B-2471 / 345-15) TaxID=666510 RepID=D9Q336_ACIS3|nr:NAD(P)/FAD-dependent oxidoreductase [Acidilobus saccharovorans]ADL19724.1 dehydrogenase [Acidilobus saccharovorans 345-15]
MAEALNIVGAGPAGASAAYAASKLGFRAVVYEANPRPAVKPCGRGIPTLSNLPFEVPKERVIADIKGAVLYVDGVKSVEVRDTVRGYIVDKEGMIRDVIASSGAELYTSSPYNASNGTVKVNGQVREVRTGLLAGGVAFYDGEKIYGVQAIVRAPRLESMDYLYIDFDTSLIGYYWIFPAEEGVEVGVGGFESPQRLRELLERYIEKHKEMLGSYSILSIAGAPIAVGGVSTGSVRGLFKVGEAAGFVLPLTGEGIRPSAISGYEAARAYLTGLDVNSVLESLNISRVVRVHRSILKALKGMSPERRRDFMFEIPAAVHEEVALGTMNINRIVKALASKPLLAAKIMKYIMIS